MENRAKITQKEKELLLRDLCARLPYNTIVCMAEGGVNGVKWNKVELTLSLLNQIEEEGAWEFAKPYLRPMSSMTEEEKEEWEWMNPIPDGCYPIGERLEMFDWLNARHFDYRGLIPMGLAIEVTEENNPYKK